MMRAGRKFRGYTQQEIARILGISQGTLSKLEQGSLIVSAPLWFEFCERLKIDPKSFLLGYIDDPELLATVSIPGDHDHDERSGFKLPRRYDFFKGSSVRVVRGILDYAREVWGEKKLAQFLFAKGMDPDFLLVLPNRINIQFPLDVLKALKESGHLSRDGLKRISLRFEKPEFQGTMGMLFQATGRHPKDVLQTIILGLDRYTRNFNHRFHTENAGAEITAEPADFLENFRPMGEIGKTLCDLKSLMLESMIHRVSSKTAKVKQTHCYFQGEDSCQFQVQF